MSLPPFASGDGGRVDRRTFILGGARLAGVAALAGAGLGGVTELVRSSGRGAVDLSDARPIVAVPVPRVITRAEWGADESIRHGTPEFGAVSKLFVHHTATTNNETNPAERIRAIYRYHVLHNGWDDIGYNFLIDQQGRVYEGRWARNYPSGAVHDETDGSGNGVVGAHVFNSQTNQGFNKGSLGIALLGDFIGVQPTDAALEALISLMAWLSATHRIDPLGDTPFVTSNGTTVTFRNIEGHKAVDSTNCPGEVEGDLPTIRRQVALRIGHGLIGYRVLRTDASVAHLGAAANLGDPAGYGVHDGAVAIASPLDSQAYWVFFENGGVFSFGGATFYGSAFGLGHGGIVDAGASPDGQGYVMLSRNGGIYCFGRFPFHGSANGIPLDGNPTCIMVHPSGSGYYIVTDRGAVYSFGEARYVGGANVYPHDGIVHGEVHPDGDGYTLLARNGSVYVFRGTYYGNMLGISQWAHPARRLVMAADGRGYLIIVNDGGVYGFGRAPFLGSDSGTGHQAVDVTPVVRT